MNSILRIAASATKYLFIVLMLLYVRRAYLYLARSDEEKKNREISGQRRILVLMVLLG